MDREEKRGEKLSEERGHMVGEGRGEDHGRKGGRDTGVQMGEKGMVGGNGVKKRRKSRARMCVSEGGRLA